MTACAICGQPLNAVRSGAHSCQTFQEDTMRENELTKLIDALWRSGRQSESPTVDATPLVGKPHVADLPGQLLFGESTND